MQPPHHKEAMNSRRLIRVPRVWKGIVAAQTGILKGPAMSALGQKRTCAVHQAMSALCQKRTLQDDVTSMETTPIPAQKSRPLARGDFECNAIVKAL